MKKVISILVALTMALSMVMAGTAALAEETANDSITVAISGDPTTLAPNGTSGDGYTYAQLYDQLWNLTDGELVMRVATGYEIVDSTHFTITIREGITDTAGNEIKASDVLFSIELAKNGSAGYPGATRYIDIENSTVDDDYTLTVAMTQPCSFQVKALSMVNLVSEASYNASPDGMVTTPVGSGPYILDEYVTGSYLTLEYNPDYWDGGDPAIKHVKVNFVSEASQRANIMLTGEANYARMLNYTDASALEAADNVVFDPYTSLNTMVIFFNNSSSSPFGGNLALRQAVAYAIEQNAIFAISAGGYGQVSKACTSSNFSDYSDSYAEISADTDYYAYDLDAAKAKLAESGIAEGTSLKIITGGGVQDTVAETIQAQLAQIGLNCEIESFPSTESTVLTSQPEDWDIGVWSWTNYPAQSGLATLNTFVSTGYLQLEGEESELILNDIAVAMQADEDSVAEAMDALMTDMYELLPCYGLYDEYRLDAYSTGLNTAFKCVDYPLYNQWSWD